MEFSRLHSQQCGSFAMSLVILHCSWMLWVHMDYFCSLGGGAEIGIKVKGKSLVSKQDEANLDWGDSNSTSHNPNNDDHDGDSCRSYLLKAYYILDTSHTLSYNLIFTTALQLWAPCSIPVFTHLSALFWILHRATGEGESFFPSSGLLVFGISF